MPAELPAGAPYPCLEDYLSHLHRARVENGQTLDILDRIAARGGQVLHAQAYLRELPHAILMAEATCPDVRDIGAKHA